MKTLFTLLLASSVTLAVAQTRQTATPTSPAPATTQTTPVLSPKAKAICKEWKLLRTENFDLVQQPTDKEKGDLLNLMDNGRYRLIYEGAAEGGTWTLDASGKWITLTSDIGGTKKFQIVSQTDKEMKIDYRDEDGTHNILIYGASTSTTPANQAR